MAIASYRIFEVMARPGAMCIEDDLAAVFRIGALKLPLIKSGLGQGVLEYRMVK